MYFNEDGYDLIQSPKQIINGSYPMCLIENMSNYIQKQTRMLKR